MRNNHMLNSADLEMNYEEGQIVTIFRTYLLDQTTSEIKFLSICPIVPFVLKCTFNMEWRRL